MDWRKFWLLNLDITLHILDTFFAIWWNSLHGAVVADSGYKGNFIVINILHVEMIPAELYSWIYDVLFLFIFWNELNFLSFQSFAKPKGYCI